MSLSIQNIPLTKEDFDNARLDEIITAAKEKICRYYCQLFYAKAKEASEADDLKSQELFTIMGVITSMYLRVKQGEEPFGPMFSFSDGHSGLPTDIPTMHLDVLKEVAPSIADPELRARIADVFWVMRKPRDHQMGGLAVDAYLESARVLEDPKHWSGGADRITRAIRIAVQLGRNNAYFRKVINYIEEVLDRYQGNDPYFFSQRMMCLLLDYKEGDPDKYVPFANKAAQRAEDEREWHRARAYYEVEARWYARTNPDQEREVRSRLAETHVKEAQQVLQSEQPSYLAASTHIEHAIREYRRAGSARERVEELRKTLDEFQKKSVSEMSKISIPMETEEYTKQAIESIKGKSLREAIRMLAFITNHPNIGQLRETVEGLREAGPLRYMIAQVRMNAEGRTTARRPPMLSGDAEDNQAMKADLLEALGFEHSFNTVVLINPARRQLVQEHNITLSDMLEIVSNNPFVRPGREHIFARGLQAGFDGDFLVAVHLLIPQIEEGLRYLLTRNGVIPYGLDKNMIQEAYLLDRILRMEETKEILGQDLTFSLQGLLVEPFGPNLRNEASHGLLNAEEFENWPSVYLWWLTLRICWQALIAKQNAQKEQTNVPISGN